MDPHFSLISNRAAEAAAWCRRHPAVNPSQDYRSLEYYVDDLLKLLSSRDMTLTQEPAVRELHDAFHRVAAVRHQKLATGARCRGWRSGDHLGTVELAGCVFDDIAAVETLGFFDEYDLPPCDTWVGFLERTLKIYDEGDMSVLDPVIVFWFPDELKDAIGQAVAVHATGAIQCAESMEDIMTQLL